MTDYINRLPNEILAKVFGYVPLRTLMRLEQVNHRWQAVQEQALTRLTSLTLYHDQFPWHYYDFFKLSFYEVS